MRSIRDVLSQDGASLRTSLALMPDEARIEVQMLLQHVLKVSRAWLLAHPEQVLDEAQAGAYAALLRRRLQGQPIAYILGEREFFGLNFKVTPATLIPRPETELLVELALKFTAELAEDANGIGRGVQLPAPEPQAQAAKRAPAEMNILDVGTGSGCIAVTLAVRLPPARLTALDISADALALARLNAQRHSVADRVTFVQSDLLSNLQPRSTSLRGQLSPITNYHLLLANLPYIPSDDFRRLPVAKHEPALALDGGPGGLDLIRRLLADAPRVMVPHGRLLLEINDEKSAEAFDLARAAFPAAHVEIHKDLAGLDRVIAISL